MIATVISHSAEFIWQYIVVVLCLGSGIFYTLYLKGVQFRGFSHAIDLLMGKHDNPKEEGHISHFQALSAALSGTIGLGNIAGVAIAISLGGPGAIFWMWLIAILGMATKYAECALGTLYRDKDPDTGEVRGGPMYYITKGLGKKWKPLALFFAFCTIMGSFGAGSMFQSNQAASALYNQFGVEQSITGILLSILVAIVIIGGIKRIGQVASKIVPFMCGIYMFGALIICIMNVDKIPSALLIIFHDAFTGQATMGGIVGAVIIAGVRRAIFSNEAGLGSAPIAHAAVKTDYPIREGIVASLGPFIDTILVCTATALVIIVSGNFGTERFQALENTIHFQSKPITRPIGDHWHFSNSLIPKSHNKFHNYRQGDTVLTYSSKNENSISFSMPIDISSLFKNEHIEGIRFSIFSNGGQHIVRLLDENGVSLGGISLTSPAKKSKEGLSLLGYHKENEWHSRVLIYDEPIKAALTKSKTLSLQFSTQGQSDLYIDKISAVRPLNGVNLTSTAFDAFFPGFGTFFITLGAFLFAFSTLITWSYYGETAAIYLFGKKSLLLYKILFISAVFFGTIIQLKLVLNFSDLMIGLMVIPNTIAILLLSQTVRKETINYFNQLKEGQFQTQKKLIHSNQIVFKFIGKISKKNNK